MTYFALALVLTAAVCHATWNLLVKRIDGGPELVWLFSVISMVLYLPVAVAVLALNLHLPHGGVLEGLVVRRVRLLAQVASRRGVAL